MEKKVGSYKFLAVARSELDTTSAILLCHVPKMSDKWVHVSRMEAN